MTLSLLLSFQIFYTFLAPVLSMEINFWCSIYFPICCCVYEIWQRIGLECYLLGRYTCSCVKCVHASRLIGTKDLEVDAYIVGKRENVCLSYIPFNIRALNFFNECVPTCVLSNSEFRIIFIRGHTCKNKVIHY